MTVTNYHKPRLETLTPEQERLIPKVWQYWFNKGYNLPFSYIDIWKLIEWAYKQINEKPPLFWVMSSPFGCEIAANLFKDLISGKNNLGDNLIANLGDNLRDNLGDNLGAKLRDNLGANLIANLGANLRANLIANLRDNLVANLHANLGANLRDNLDANLRDNLDANLRDNLKIKFESFSYYIDISDFGWVSFYDFLYRINYTIPIFRRFISLFRKGCPFMWIPLRGVAIISLPPTKILKEPHPTRKKIWQLHSNTGMAIQFADGWGQYYVHGIYFKSELFHQFFPRSEHTDVTLTSILQVKNAEQRASIIQEYGMERLFKDMNGTTRIDWEMEIDKLGRSRKGELWQFTYDNQTYKCLIVPDTATDREYYFLVDPRCDSYDHAKKWHNGYEPDEWDRVIYVQEDGLERFHLNKRLNMDRIYVWRQGDICLELL